MRLMSLVSAVIVFFFLFISVYSAYAMDVDSLVNISSPNGSIRIVNSTAVIDDLSITDGVIFYNQSSTPLEHHATTRSQKNDGTVL